MLPTACLMGLARDQSVRHQQHPCPTWGRHNHNQFRAAQNTALFGPECGWDMARMWRLKGTVNRPRTVGTFSQNWNASGNNGCRRDGGAARKTPQKRHLIAMIWQGHQGSNPGPTVLETVALPAELYPYSAAVITRGSGTMQGPKWAKCALRRPWPAPVSRATHPASIGPQRPGTCAPCRPARPPRHWQRRCGSRHRASRYLRAVARW